jgi:hypothetical protein
MIHQQDLLAIEQKLVGDQKQHENLIESYRGMGDCSRAFKDNDGAWEYYEQAVNCVAVAKDSPELHRQHLLLCESMNKVKPSSVLDIKIGTL